VIFTAASGQPYSARVGNIDLNNDGNTRNDYAPGTSRNQYNLPAYSSLDLRIGRTLALAGTVRLLPMFEVYNLVNADNVNSVNSALYGVSGTTLTPNAAFGQPLSTAGQRIIQLAIRVLF
jgi:hypothetical protein